MRSASESTNAPDAAEALARARYVYVPFPELLEQTPVLAASLQRDWVRAPALDSAGWLFARPGSLPKRRAAE